MHEDQSQVPSDEMFKFVLEKVEGQLAPRLGRLIVRGRTPIETPSYLVSTSRGVVPHVTQDMLQKHTSVSTVYIGLEDFIEKKIENAPLLSDSNPAGRRLRGFIGLPDQYLSILGPRRLSPVPSAQATTNSSIGISTSVGFSNITVKQYIEAASSLGPDMVIAIADVVPEDGTSIKRIAKSVDRTHAWLRDTLQDNSRGYTILASLPALEQEKQSSYLSDLGGEYASQIQGLCLHDSATMASIPRSLGTSFRLCPSEPRDPHEILGAIEVGIDMISIPFVTTASEAGVALQFSLSDIVKSNNSSSDAGKTPLGIDMWSKEHAAVVAPLQEGCDCYACKRHHRAYVHHLLQAGEMLAWTLLQVHNLHVIHNFFQCARRYIQDGTYEHHFNVFRRKYATEFPKQTGEGPRTRGYQVKSVGGGEPRKNTKAYGRLDEQALKLAEAEKESSVPTVDQNAQVLEVHGVGQAIPSGSV